MAITLEDKPYPMMAAFNSCYYRMKSTNSTQPGFYYKMRVIMNGFEIAVIREFSYTPPNGEDGYFDASVVTSLLTNYKLEATRRGQMSTFWKIMPNAFVQVQFAEAWVNSPPPVYAISHTFQVWGAAKDTDELYQVYKDFRYIWQGVGNGTPQGVDNSQVQNLTDEKVYETTSSYYCLYNYNGGNFKGIKIDVFALDGTFISTSTIYNPYFNSTDASKAFTVCDVGMWSLRDAIPDTGTYPILPLTGTDFYYTLSFVWQSDKEYARPIKKFIPSCSPVYPVYPIYYKSRLGAWETAIFKGNSIVSNQVTKDKYGSFVRTPENELFTLGEIYNPMYSTSLERVRNIRVEKILDLNTEWIDEATVEKYRDIISSPQVYTGVNYGFNNKLIEVRPDANTFILNKRYNKKKYQLSMRFRYSNIENRQA